MPLNFTVKTNANNPASKPAERPGVRINQPTPSTARAQALKQRLTGQPQSQAPAPRHAGTTARAEQLAKLKSYAPTPAARPAAPPAGSQPFADVEPPPSGDPNVRAGGAPPASTPAPAAPAAPVAAQAPKVDGTPPATAEAPSDQTGVQFDVLARKERQLRKAQQALQAEKAALQQERAGLVNKNDIGRDFVSRADLNANPLKVLADAGITYGRLTELQLAQLSQETQQPQAQPQDALTTQLLNKISQLEKQLDERFTKFDQSLQERDSQAKQQALKQIRNDVELLVSSDSAYETIAATDEFQAVVDLIERVFDEEGIVLPVEDAARQVEDKLRTREYERYQRLGQLSHIRSRQAPASSPAAPVTAAQQMEATEEPQHTAPLQAQQAAPQQSQTLTNEGAINTRPLTPRERAIARIKGDLT